MTERKVVVVASELSASACAKNIRRSLRELYLERQSSPGELQLPGARMFIQRFRSAPRGPGLRTWNWRRLASPSLANRFAVVNCAFRVGEFRGNNPGGHERQSNQTFHHFRRLHFLGSGKALSFLQMECNLAWALKRDYMNNCSLGGNVSPPRQSHGID